MDSLAFERLRPTATADMKTKVYTGLPISISDVFPETFSEPRAKVTCAEKAVAKAQKKAAQEEATNTLAPEETTLAIIPKKPPIMQTTEPEEATAESVTTENTTEQVAESLEPAADTETSSESSNMEISYNVTGPAGKNWQPQ